MKTRLAFREIFHNSRFSFSYVFNLSFGLFGFLLLNSFSASVQENFQDRSQALLTADLAVSSRRQLTTEEKSILDQLTRGAVGHTHSMEMSSMISARSGTRLASLVAIESAYPLYGEIVLGKNGRVTGTQPKSILQKPLLWISPELGIQMKLGLGDPIKIGSMEFRVEDQVEQDSGAGWQGFTLAPRIYLGLQQLEKTGLIRPGSTIRYRSFYRFQNEAEVEQAAQALQKNLTDPSIQITTHKKAGEQIGKIMDYLSDFLGLVALVGLFLACLGSSYLFHSFISKRMGEIATLISLGLPHRQAIQVYVIQIFFLGSLAATLALGGTQLFLPLCGHILSRYLAFPLHLRLSPLPAMSAILTGLGASLLICLPLLNRIRGLKPNLLFQESQTQTSRFLWKSVLSWIPAFLFFYGVCLWQAHSWKVGSIFFWGLTVSGVVLAGLISFGLTFLGRTRVSKYLPLKLSTRYLIHNPISTTAVFLAMGVGALLMNLLPQIQRSISAEISQPEVSKIPSLFLFDIQDDQFEGFREFVQREHLGLLQASPMIRARLEAVNGKPFERDSRQQASTREEEQETQMRNRGFNLTIRDKLSESESIVAGQFFSGPFREGIGTQGAELKPEISVEKEYAETLGLHLGDVLEFDIQGVPVSGKISSLRKVRWTSFQPNFFIEFQPGVLEGAPKTYIAALEKMTVEQKIQTQNELVRLFPNISIIDVSAVIQTILQVFSQMIWAIQVMALLAVGIALLVLFSIARHQTQARVREIQLLKILGAETQLVSTTQWIEFAGIGFVSSLFGVTLSAALSWGLCYFLFDSAWEFSWILPVLTVASITVLAWAITVLAVRGSMAQKPAGLL